MPNPTPADVKAADAAKAQADIDAARQEGAATALTAERERIAAIVDCDEAKDREELARHFAFSTSMSPADAKAALAKAPAKQTPASTAAHPANRFEAAMKTAGNPAVGADTGGEPETEEAKSIAFADSYFAAKRGHQNRRA